jgi:hypothetical protein
MVACWLFITCSLVFCSVYKSSESEVSRVIASCLRDMCKDFGSRGPDERVVTESDDEDDILGPLTTAHQTPTHLAEPSARISAMDASQPDPEPPSFPNQWVFKERQSSHRQRLHCHRRGPMTQLLCPRSRHPQPLSCQLGLIHRCHFRGASNLDSSVSDQGTEVSHISGEVEGSSPRSDEVETIGVDECLEGPSIETIVHRRGLVSYS